MVERYRASKDEFQRDGSLVEDCDGDAVLYSEYEALQTKLARLVEAASRAYSEWDGGSHEEAIVAMRQLKAAIEAAKVKP